MLPSIAHLTHTPIEGKNFSTELKEWKRRNRPRQQSKRTNRPTQPPTQPQPPRLPQPSHPRVVDDDMTADLFHSDDDSNHDAHKPQSQPQCRCPPTAPDGDLWDDSGDSEYEEPTYDHEKMKKMHEEFLILHAENKARQREADMRADEMERERASEVANAAAAAERAKQERDDEMQRQLIADRERRARERSTSPYHEDAQEIDRELNEYLKNAPVIQTINLTYEITLTNAKCV